MLPARSEKLLKQAGRRDNTVTDVIDFWADF